MENTFIPVFSSFEKQIIDKAISLGNSGGIVNLKNMLVDESGLIGTATEFEVKKLSDTDFSIHYSKPVNIASEKDKKWLNEIEQKLYDIVFLLEELEKKQLIHLVDEKYSSTSEAPAYQQNIPLSKDLQKQLCDLWDKKIIVMFSLKTLQQHDYLEENLYETRKQNKWYRILTIITILVSLASTGVQLYIYNSSKDSTQKVSIESVNDTVKIEQANVYKFVK